MNTVKTLEKQIKAARAKVGEFKFGTQEWEDAMQIVRGLTTKLSELTVWKEEHFSIDSGVHRTRLLDGRVIG